MSAGMFAPSTMRVISIPSLLKVHTTTASPFSPARKVRQAGGSYVEDQ